MVSEIYEYILFRTLNFIPFNLVKSIKNKLNSVIIGILAPLVIPFLINDKLDPWDPKPVIEMTLLEITLKDKFNRIQHFPPL